MSKRFVTTKGFFHTKIISLLSGIYQYSEWNFQENSKWCHRCNWWCKSFERFSSIVLVHLFREMESNLVQMETIAILEHFLHKITTQTRNLVVVRIPAWKFKIDFFFFFFISFLFLNGVRISLLFLLYSSYACVLENHYRIRFLFWFR